MAGCSADERRHRSPFTTQLHHSSPLQTLNTPKMENPSVVHTTPSGPKTLTLELESKLILFHAAEQVRHESIVETPPLRTQCTMTIHTAYIHNTTRPKPFTPYYTPILRTTLIPLTHLTSPHLTPISPPTIPLRNKRPDHNRIRRSPHTL